MGRADVLREVVEATYGAKTVGTGVDTRRPPRVPPVKGRDGDAGSGPVRNAVRDVRGANGTDLGERAHPVPTNARSLAECSFDASTVVSRVSGGSPDPPPAETAASAAAVSSLAPSASPCSHPRFRRLAGVCLKCGVEVK